MRIQDFIWHFMVIFVPLCICFIIYFYVYLYKAYKLATYHYYGLISDEVYEEFFDSKIRTFKEMNAWHKKANETIRTSKEKKDMQA